MYVPAHFQPVDPQEALKLIQAAPLGMLVHTHEGALDANHIPFEIQQNAEGGIRLIGHVAKANPLCEQLASGAQVMVVFRAEEGYISPNWYPSKHAEHKLVPTWNYRVVHLHGQAFLHPERKWVLGAVGQLTRAHESATQSLHPHAAGPWKIKDTDPAALDAMLAAIVGLEIVVDRVEAKFKLSQNRNPEDQAAAAHHAAQAGNQALSDAMRTYRP